MTRDNRFEEQLASLAQRMGPAVDRVDDVELSEELLLEYYAGILPPEQEAKVARLAALSPWATDYLAKLELDQESAAELVDRAPAWSFVTRRLAAWRVTPMRSLGFASGALMAAVALFLVLPPLLDSAPEHGAGIYSPLGTGQRKSIVELPGGARIGDVDANWVLHVPLKQVSELRWFVWDKVEGASSYDFQLIGPAGEGLYVTTGLHKPQLKLAGSVRDQLVVAAEHAWIVEAKDANGVVIARAVARFQLVPGS